MKRRIWTITAGLAALAALIAVPAAMAAYTSAKLEVTRTATGVVVKASLDPNDDPTARVAINAPVGTQLTTSQAPGTVLGPGARDREGARPRRRRPSARGSARRRRAGTGPGGDRQAAVHRLDASPLATWVMVLTAAGQTLTVPTYLVPTQPTAQLGPAFIAICLPPPDVPVGHAGTRDVRREGLQRRAHDQRRVQQRCVGCVDLLLGAVQPRRRHGERRRCRRRTGGHRPRCGDPLREDLGEGARLSPVESRRAVRRARCDGHDLRLPRRQPASRSVGSARVAANGAFTFKAQVGTFFRARAVAAAGRGAGGVRRSSAADQHRSVRQPDGERVQRAEQGRSQEEVDASVRRGSARPAPYASSSAGLRLPNGNRSPRESLKPAAFAAGSRLQLRRR